MTQHAGQVDGLDITPVDDGFIIYDRPRDRVHYLNHTAGLVLMLCDGANGGDEIARLLQRQYALPEPPAAEISAVLAQFADEGLIATDQERPGP